MAYNPTADFLALIRNTDGAAYVARMPGLDFVVDAMARAGMFRLYVGQTAPIVNQPTTVWLKPSVPSWVAEGTVWLWDASTGAYALATPALWNEFFRSADVFQSVTSSSAAVAVATDLLAIQRAAPAVTVLTLPSVADRPGRKVQIVDWSTAVVGHQIVLTPAAGETIMKLGAFQLYSTTDQLAGVTLRPSVNLSGWVIAP